MALIGRQLTSGNYLKLDDISSQFNSTKKTFNLTIAGQPFYPGSVFSVLISVGGVIQEPIKSYTIDQATITFASAPTGGSTFFGIVLGLSLGIGVPADSTVTGAKLSSPFNYNSGLLYLDTANNRVGILSASPTVTLDVVGNTKVSGTTNLNGLSVSGITTLSGTTIFNPGPVLVGTATSTGTANQRLQVNGGAYFSSGLGIGTATPSGSLDVSGGTIRVRNNGTYAEPLDNAGVLAYDSALSEFTVSSRSSSTNSYLRFLTSNSGTSGEKVRITAEGNLLVGTASSTGTASQPLQVSGGAYVSANLGVGRANPTYKIDAFGGSGLRVGGVSGDGYLLAYDTSTGNTVALEATDFATTTKRNLAIQHNGGNVLVGSATSTGTLSQPLQVTGGAYVSSNVGIGTTNPTSKLHVNGDVLLSSINSGQLAGFRNRIINGSMAISQRSTSATVTAGTAVPTGSTGYPAVDRWFVYSSGANVTAARVAGSGATQYRQQITGAASVTAIGVGQRIEQLNSYDLAGSTATLSVDLANSLLTTVTWTASYATTADTFGTIATPTKTQIATGTFTVTNTVTRYSTQISIPAGATTGIEILFTVGAQTSGTWTIGNVQLENGSVATPFEYHSYGQELQLCERYYEKSYALSTAPGTNTGPSTGEWVSVTINAADYYNFGYLAFKTRKRISPTMTFWSTDGTINTARQQDSANVTAVVRTTFNETSGSFGCSGATANYYHRIHWTASAEIL